MIYTQHISVPFGYGDAQRHLTPAGTLELMQELANLHTNAVVSADYLAHSGRVWLLSAWRVEFLQPCSSDDVLTGSTWGYSSERLFARRNFLLKDAAGEVCARGDSVWFLIDSEKRRPVRITETDMQWYELSPALEMEQAPRRLKLPETMIEQACFAVRRYMLDRYGHVNNVWYVRLAMEYLPECAVIACLEADYQLAAHMGDTIVPAVAQDGKNVTVSLSNPEGKRFAAVHFTLA